MRTDRDSQLRDDQEGPATRLRGALRRMAVRLTGAAWQLLGYRGAYGEDEVASDVEVFQGIGFASRPASGSTGAEAIVASVGAEAGHGVVVAARDRSIEPDLAADETATFNAQTVVLHKANGTIEARSVGGAAAELAKKSDLQTLYDAIDGAVIVANDGGASFKATLLAALDSAGFPVGTTKLKGE